MASSSGLLICFIVTFLFTASSAAPVEITAMKRSPAVPEIAGAPVVFGPGTYPRANKLSDGSILGTYTAFNGGDNIIEIVLSKDDGESWTYQGEVTRGASNTNDIDNPYDPTNGAYTFFRISIAYSDDSGKSWTFLSQPAADPGPVNGNWEPFLRIAQDGTLQIYYSRENSAADQDTLERSSTDGGATWIEAQTISGAGMTSRDGMTGVTTVAGSTLMAVFESESSGTFTINDITSTDDGKTWGGRKAIYTPSSINTSAGAPQIVTVGATLAVSFMTNEDSQMATPSSSYTINTAAKFISSGDGGNTWGNKKTIGEVQSVWPGLYTLDETNVLMMFDNGGAKAQKITLS